ncbi:restriction endonuclease subunit S [Chryseobacterium sp.]|uniref:restriction endonuclease subunit S n=1 Tax=Chryseobacterium sp. TaxID=1871047 RepID=UPI002355CEA9|nr:restriction endonuclease subunit S [Chryseobacterium sp.]
MQRYEKYKDSGVDWIGEIPKHWECKRLGTWFTERREKVSDKDYAPLSVTKNGVVPQLDNAAKSNDGDNRKLVKDGDFVINSRSDRKGSSGLSVLDGSVSLINIVMKPRNIDGKFSQYLLKSRAFVEEFYRNGHGIVADLWTTRFDEMKFINISIPPIKEQQTIATFLDDKTAKIDQTIANKEKEIELLKERRQILIQKAVTKGLDDTVKLKDSGVDWIGEIPEHWEVRKLKYCLSSKLKYGANESGVDYDLELPRYVRITDFGFDGKLSEDKKLSLTWHQGKDYLLKDGDILFARSGATVGKSYQFKTSMSFEKHYSFAGYLIKAEANEEILLSDYLYLYTNSNLFDNWKSAIFNKATIENIGADKYSTLSVVVPPVKEQEEILLEYSSKNEKIAKAILLKQQEIEKLKEYKTVLIDNVVTGKVRVR